MVGTIVNLITDRKFGFIKPEGAARNSENVFFHASVLADDLEFDERLYEMRVEFEAIGTDRGLKAVNVRPA